MSKSTPPPTSRVQTGFTIHSSDTAEVNVGVDEDGYLVIKQDDNIICIPPQAVVRFKRAVGSMGEIA